MNINELLTEAKKSFVEGNLENSILYLKTVLEIEKSNYQALYRLIKLYNSLGFFDKVLEYGEEAIKYYKDDLGIIFNVGYAYQSIGKYKKAIKYYKDYLQIEEDYFVVLNIGLCYTELKYYKKALQMFNKAIIINSLEVSAYIDKAECLKNMKKYDEAMKLYEKVLGFEEKNESYIYFKMGELKIEEEKYDEGINYFNIAISLESATDFTFENYFDILLELKKYDEIEKLLLEYSVRDTSREKVLNMEGKFASEIKDFDRAKKVCERLLILNSENPMYYLNSAYVCEMQNNFEKALEFVEKASKYVKNEEIIKLAKKRILKSRREYNKKIKSQNNEI